MVSHDILEAARRRRHHPWMRALVLLVLLLLAPSAWAQPRPDARPGPPANLPADPRSNPRPDPRADPRKAELDTLITALKSAPSESVAAAMELRIRQIWQQAGSPAAGLLMSRGIRDMRNDAEEEALQDFEAALALEPDFADAYHRRALARFALGDYAGAVRDIEETLKREPRHFPALQSLSRIAESRNDFRGAVAAWRKAMELSPMTPNGAERLKLLLRRQQGEQL